MCTCARLPPVDEPDNGEVVCVKCVKGKAGSSSAVIHLYFRAELWINRHLAGEREKTHCRHQSHSYESTQSKCSASWSTRFSQWENKKIDMKSIIGSTYLFFFYLELLTALQLGQKRHRGMWRVHSAYIENMFVPDHSEEMWNHKIVLCPYKCVSIHSWVCLCVEMTNINLGVKQKGERHTKKNRRAKTLVHAANHIPNLCQQWVPDGAHHHCAMSLKQGGERKIKSGMWNREALPNVDDVSYK